MRPDFKQNVAMKVTREQFERDLKEPLEKLGYEGCKQNRWNNPESGAVFLHTEKRGIYNWYSHTERAYHIEDYNPKLFLAIAAMTENEIPIVGEWVKSEDFNIGTYSFSKVAKVEKGFGVIHLEEDVGDVIVGYSRGCDEIKKLTLEELVEHLGEDEQHTQDGFVLPEKWIVKTDNAEDEKIVREYLNRKYDAGLNDSNPEVTWYFASEPFSWCLVSSDKNDFKDYTEIAIEQFKKHVLNMEFTKDDLKTGMVVELNNGEMSLVLKNTSKGNVLVSYEPDTYEKNFWSSLDCLNYDLTKDVTKVYDIPSKNSGSLNLIWERKEEPKEYIITPEQAKSIIDIACNDWKDKLFDLWGKQIIFKKDITVSYPFYKQMRNAFASSQNELFNEIFK